LKQKAKLVVVLGLILLSACSGPPTEQELEVWIRGAQFTKLDEFVADPNNPTELRVRALELLVEYGRLADLRDSLQTVSDRQDLVDRLVTKLIENLQSEDTDLQLQSEYGLVNGVLLFLTEQDKEKVLTAVADWAFSELSKDTPMDELKARLDATIASDLDKMGTHGLRVASWLIGYGIESKRFVSYMAAESKTDEHRKLLLNAVRKNLQLVDEKGNPLVIDSGIIQTLIDDPIPETVGLLIDVYMNEAFDDEERSNAFGLVQTLVRDSGNNRLLSTEEKRKVVVDALRPALKSRVATDRWDAIDLILEAGGAKAVSTALDGLQEDLKNYDRWTDDGAEREGPDIVIAELCSQHLAPKRKTARKMLEKRLKGSNRYQLAFVIMCLKAVGNKKTVKRLKQLAKDETDLEDFFFTKKMRKRRAKLIEKKRIPPLTVGTLAKNAMEGIGLVASVNKKVKAKSMTKADAAVHRDAIIASIQYLGPQLKHAIEKRYLRLRAEQLARKADDQPTIGKLLKLIKACSPKAIGEAGCAVALEMTSAVIADEEGAVAVDTDEKKKKLIAVLKPLLKADVATTRWGAMDLLLDLSKGRELATVLSSLGSELSDYTRKTSDRKSVDPHQVITELCDQRILPIKDLARPALEASLNSKSLMAVGFATLCLKTLGDSGANKALRGLSKNKKSLEGVLFSRKEQKKRRKRIAADEEEEVTVAGLASNAVTGIELLEAIGKATSQGKITADQASSRREVVLAFVTVSGDYYRQYVEQVWAKQGTDE